jgi:hypothetical protein
VVVFGALAQELFKAAYATMAGTAVAAHCQEIKENLDSASGLLATIRQDLTDADGAPVLVRTQIYHAGLEFTFDDCEVESGCWAVHVVDPDRKGDDPKRSRRFIYNAHDRWLRRASSG